MLFSLIGVVAGASGGKGSLAANGSALLLLLNLSWPTSVISLVAIVIGVRVFRKIKPLAR